MANGGPGVVGAGLLEAAVHGWRTSWIILRMTCCPPRWTSSPAPEIIKTTLPKIQPISPLRVPGPLRRTDGFSRSRLHRKPASAVWFHEKEIQYKRFASLRGVMALLPVQNAILDGELVCLDSDGRSQFMELTRRRRQDVCYYAFDLLWADG